MSVRILRGHVLDGLLLVPDQSVQCIVTSPPYWGLRDYGLEPQVWGGEPGCVHRWGDEVAKTRSSGLGKSTLGIKHGVPTMTQACITQQQLATRIFTASQGAFCQICQAWRGSLGLEPTPDLYLSHLVGVFRAVWRVLKDDGTLWLNMGDSYAGSWGAQSRPNGTDRQSTLQGGSMLHARQIAAHPRGQTHTSSLKHTPGLKPKDLIGMPWRLAFALQAEGWYLRSDIIWHKPNPMPESVRDRPTRAHEYLFLLTKREKYFYDADAVREPHTMKPQRRPAGRPTDETPRPNGQPKQSWSTAARDVVSVDGHPAGRNLRSVWTIPTHPFPGAHFATFPPALVEPCIKAGSKPGHTILDPFAGAGTVPLVADRLGREAIAIELSPAYVEMMRARLQADAPLFWNLT